MKRFSFGGTADRARMVGEAWRRKAWITDGLTPRKAANLALAGAQWALKHEAMRAWPVVAKVDISPLCNLHCTVCVHALPSAGSGPLLAQQQFRREQRMPVERYREIVAQLAGRTAAVSLYYLGDPLMHPHLEEICAATREAGINSHVSTNFSFELSDERLRALLASGLTHLTVCVDGLSQETYGRTRVGGRIDRVLDNLDRLLRLRRESRRTYPRVEVQYVKFQHNLGELQAARARCLRAGVDQFTEFWGSLYNYTDFDDGRVQVGAPLSAARVPRCLWPHFALLVRYDGGVIPCCTFRTGVQYVPGAERRELGNVFEQGVWEVWNSPAYRALRRLTADPRRAEREAALASTFCEGCPQLYASDHLRHRVRADTHAWEALYEHDARGRVVRKPLVQLGGPSRN